MNQSWHGELAPMAPRQLALIAGNVVSMRLSFHAQ